MGDNRDGVEDLSAPECLRLLREHDLGRIAVIVDERPQVFPVNYAMDDQERFVVIRTFEDVRLAHAPLMYVAFEIDDVDRGGGVAWSVLVQGIGEDVSTAIDKESVALRQLDIQPLAPGGNQRWLAISVDRVTGRRFRLKQG